MAGDYTPDGMRRMSESSYVSEPIWEDCDAGANGGAELDLHDLEDGRGAHDIATTIHNRDLALNFAYNLYSTTLEAPNSTFDANEWDLEATGTVNAGVQVTHRTAGPVRWMLPRGKSSGAAFTDKLDVQYRKHYQ